MCDARCWKNNNLDSVCLSNRAKNKVIINGHQYKLCDTHNRSYLHDIENGGSYGARYRNSMMSMTGFFGFVGEPLGEIFRTQKEYLVGHCGKNEKYTKTIVEKLNNLPENKILEAPHVNETNGKPNIYKVLVEFNYNYVKKPNNINLSINIQRNYENQISILNKRINDQQSKIALLKNIIDKDTEITTKLCNDYEYKILEQSKIIDNYKYIISNKKTKINDLLKLIDERDDIISTQNEKLQTISKLCTN
jgi:hypothetical protein